MRWEGGGSLCVGTGGYIICEGGLLLSRCNVKAGWLILAGHDVKAGEVEYLYLTTISALVF